MLGKEKLGETENLHTMATCWVGPKQWQRVWQVGPKASAILTNIILVL